MKFLSKKIVALVAGSLAILGSVSAQADTPNATTTFNSTATVEKACLISATELAFGSIIPTEAATVVGKTSNITVTCSNSLPYFINMNFGINDGTATNRFMKNAANADKLAYNVYLNSGYQLLFGEGNFDGSISIIETGNGASQIKTLYGRLISNQFVSSGTYSDTLTLNIGY